MPRAGLTADKVAEAAADLADEGGFERLNLSAVARRCGVADPSLYSHVTNLADLRSRVARLARAELADRLGAAVEGRAGRGALAAYAAAYRRYALDHPGRIAAVEEPAAPGEGDDGARIVRASYAVLAAYDLVEPDLTDAVRLVRSALHGVTDLERRGRFLDPAPVDVSFTRIVDALDAALTHWPHRPGPPPVASTRHRFAVPGGSIPYELRGSGPLLVLVGGPVTRAGYAGLAAALAADHTVLTADPRGFGESERRDQGDLTPAALAADLAALLDALGAGPARLVGCSGGAVVALTLALARPDLVAGVVAHEPPLVRLLDDPGLLARVEEVRAAYRAGGAVAGTASLARLVGGAPPDGQPIAADPTDLPEADTGETKRDVAAFLGDLLVPTLTTDVDPVALAAVPGLVVAVGAGSAGELPHRCAAALAERTGRPLVTFPGGHLAASTHPAAFADAVRRAG
jgi:pimeloyl-ACP methyl ester carboxylesterase